MPGKHLEKTSIQKFRGDMRRHPSWPVVLAEGDSWFAFPTGHNIPSKINAMAKRKLVMMKLQTNGHEVTEIMAGAQRRTLRDRLNTFHFDMILFSGGGNDIVGVDLESILKEKGPHEVLEELKGEALIGRSYDGPFDHYEAAQTPLAGGEPGATVASEHRVIAWKEVAATEGTGIVHIAPGCGKEDFGLGKEEGLARLVPIDDAEDDVRAGGVVPQLRAVAQHRQIDVRGRRSNLLDFGLRQPFGAQDADGARGRLRLAQREVRGNHWRGSRLRGQFGGGSARRESAEEPPTGQRIVCHGVPLRAAPGRAGFGSPW